MWNSALPKIFFLSFSLLVDATTTRKLDTIDTAWKCYRVGESIQINYSTETLSKHNWIGIYKTDDGVTPASDHWQTVAWQWACGNSAHKCKAVDSVSFEFDLKPLEAGQYFAFLHADESQGHTSSVSSKPFIVREETDQELNNCKDDVHVEKNSYIIGDTISVAFENSSTEVGDWIGIYPARNLVGIENNFAIPTLWLFGCGDRECLAKIDHDIITFDTWSLQLGEYKAVLGRWNADGFVVVLAESETFSVTHNIHNDCDASPITDQSCYGKGDDIFVSFGSSCAGPTNSDKVALYTEESDLTNGLIGPPKSRIPNICDRQDCSTGKATLSTRVKFDSGAMSLQSGLYKVAWWRTNRGGIPVAIESEPFEIKNFCPEQNFSLRANVATR